MTSHHPCSWVWVINADCELEFERPTRYQATAPTKAALQEHRPLFLALTADEPSFFPHELSARRFTEESRALFWSPTPSVQTLARRAGLRLPATPGLATLREVNDKSFLGRALPRFVHPQRKRIDSEPGWRRIREGSPGPLRVRRPFGFAGRGARVLPLEESPDDERFLQDSLRKGPLVVEPELSALAQWSIHGVTHGGKLLLGEPCSLQTDRAGAPLGSPRAAHECPARGRLREIAKAAGTALWNAGYFGPFGVDVLETPEGLFATDLNARFTLGFSAGLGPLRPSAIELCLDTVPKIP